jgi:ATP-dependent Clp protease ATP-binding subunit ClpA
MTSNLGSKDNDSNQIGFGSQERSGEDDRAMKDFFKPELRNRIDAIVKFGRLDGLAIKKIVVKFVDELKESLLTKNIRLTLTEGVVDHLADKGYDRKMGARPLARLIDTELKSPLSRRVLFGDLVNGGKVSVKIVDDKLDFTVTELAKPLTKEERKAIKAQKAEEAKAKIEENTISSDQTGE